MPANAENPGDLPEKGVLESIFGKQLEELKTGIENFKNNPIDTLLRWLGLKKKVKEGTQQERDRLKDEIARGYDYEEERGNGEKIDRKEMLRLKKVLFGSNAQEVRQNLEWVKAFGYEFQVNKAIAERIRKVASEVGDWRASQCVESFCWRKVRGYENKGEEYLSEHSFAIAVDMDAEKYRMGQKECCPPDHIIAAFERNGFEWGGRWKSRPDPMHFELRKDIIMEMAKQRGIMG